MTDMNKQAVRRKLRETLAAMGEAERHAKSVSACRFMIGSPEFDAARVVMLYLSTPTEIDTASLALRCWQEGKQVVVPKVSWDQRRILPVEISTLKDGLTTTGPVREPIAGKPCPIDLIDLVIVPGLGFSTNGFPHRARDGVLRPLPGAGRLRRPFVWAGVRGSGGGDAAGA
jgi:5-formyltetrahydrofolate cyclo-ligase